MNTCVRAALRVLPDLPGVYIFRARSGKAVYVGRAARLRTRVRSHWSARGGESRRIVSGVAWIEPVVCASDHEAAMLEHGLLESSLPVANRTSGVESPMLLELQSDRHRVAAIHSTDPVGGTRYGPYLGGAATRLAADALNALFPLGAFGSDPTPFARELARARGIRPSDALKRELVAFLAREARTVDRVLARLADQRNIASAKLRFEHAARLQAFREALRWVSSVQRVRRREPTDADGVATADTGACHIHVLLRMRGGVLVEPRWSRTRRPPSVAERSVELDEMARENAELLVELALAGALPPARQQ